jgi:protein-tyrosine phosphatase
MDWITSLDKAKNNETPVNWVVSLDKALDWIDPSEYVVSLTMHREFPWNTLPDMRKHCTVSEIVDNNIYLGGLGALQKVKKLGVTLVVSLCNCEALKGVEMPDEVTWLKFHVQDSESQDLTAIAFTVIPHMRDHDKVLVHCMAGMSRSVTIVIAYLMNVRKWDLKTAFLFVRDKRPVACPNIGFMRQLNKLSFS